MDIDNITSIKSSIINRKIIHTHQKQPSRGVLRKRCSENMQHIYRRTPMPKCDFNKVALQLRTPFLKNTSGRLLLTHLILFFFMLLAKKFPEILPKHKGYF